MFQRFQRKRLHFPSCCVTRKHHRRRGSFQRCQSGGLRPIRLLYDLFSRSYSSLKVSTIFRVQFHVSLLLISFSTFPSVRTSNSTLHCHPIKFPSILIKIFTWSWPGPTNSQQLSQSPRRQQREFILETNAKLDLAVFFMRSKREAMLKFKCWSECTL